MPAAEENGFPTLFLCGDVMTGRGIDQILPHPSEPTLYEGFVRDARDYVALAERASGEIPRRVPPEYIWGDVLAELNSRQPALRVINLETSATSHDSPWPGKGINYRMHPDNIDCLQALGVDCCALANNHVLDWEQPGLRETLTTLEKAGIRYCGAGMSAEAAREPAALDLSARHRLLVVSCGAGDSGIPAEWAATDERPGVYRLPDFSDRTADGLRRLIDGHRRPGDRVVVSVHWGGNWGYPVSEEHRHFAHRLIERAGVDIVHGHSSHHPRGMEVYRNRLILYGCGDFINDYEGIGGHEQYRPDLTLGYLVTFAAASGELQALTMVPFQLRKFRLQYTNQRDAEWLAGVLSRAGRPLGTSVTAHVDNTLSLEWK